MDEEVYEEDVVLLINDLKIKWFTLLSRVDASPTIDETVLTSLNSIANVLISNRPADPSCDILFEAALRLGVFESIFRWNFVFCGADLEAFKAKELQFYDTLITGDGKQYLRYPEFAIPLLATLHHCAIRSSLSVERVLVRTLNSVCAAMCAQFTESMEVADSVYPNERGSSTRESGVELTEDLSFFRRLSMGLVADCRNQMSSKLTQLNVDSIHTTNELNSLHADVGDAVDWSLSIDSNTAGPSDTMATSIERSMSFTSRESSCNIDSIFDLLIPFVFREGDLGWQARDAFLLVATYSNKDEDFSYSLAGNSSVCPVIATGLATLYAELPREMISNNYPQSWPELIQTVEEQEQKSAQFIEFFGALEFCESVLEVAHPLIQSSLLQFIHSGFFVSVLGFALTKPNVLEVITATVLLKEILVRTTNSAILPALLRFLLTTMPEEKHATEPERRSAPDGDRHSTSSDVTEDQTGVNNHDSREPLPTTSTYMDLLISRLHYCNTLLGVATLSLFNTILNLNCEDVMFYLVLRHLVPFRDALFALGWSWPEPNTFVRASDDFLNLIASYQYGSTARRRRWTSSASSEGGSLNDSVAELNLDEDTESSEATTKTAATGIVTDSMVSSEWSEKSPPYPVRGMVDTTAGLSGQSGYHAPGEVGARAVLPGRAPMAPLMPAHSESFSSPVMNGIDQVIDMSGTRMDQFKHLFRRRKPQWDGPQSPSGVTPNDWLKYTNWARESIQRRVQACVSWRLVFDAIYPSAAQMAQFELSWNRTDSRERISDTSEDDSVGNHVHRVKSKPDITTSHRRFKCFVNHNPTTLSEKQLQGERTAQALHSAVAKLDIDTELDLDELDEPTEASHVLFKSAYPPIAPTEPNDGCMKNSNLTHRLNPTERMLNGDLVNGAVVCEYQKVGPRQTKHSDYNYSDDADSTDSGCLVTDTRFNRDFKSQGTSLPTSTSEKNLTPSRLNNHSLSNSSAVKSWYRLNFLESDSSDHVLEGESLNPAQLHTSNSTDELHEIDLSQQCPTSTPKNGRYHTEESMNLNHAEVRALLNASKNEDLEQFVQCLEDVHCASPKTAISKQRALSTDLQSYAIYFDHLLNGENNCKSPPRGPTHQYSHSVMVQKSFPHSEVNDQFKCFSGAIENRHRPDHTNTESSCTKNGPCVLSSCRLRQKKPLVAANAGTALNADATTNRRLSRSISHQTNKIADQFASTATHYLGALTRRHSAQEAEGLEKSNDLDDICPDIKHGSDYLNPTNIPNLGPFLTTIVARLESLPHNCFYANLYLTSILSSLASYSQPLLRAIMLLVPPNTSTERSRPDRASTESAKPEDLAASRSLREAYSQLPYAVLCSVRKQLDLFSTQYTMCPPNGMTISFMALVMDAKQYFRHANEVPCQFTSSNHLSNNNGELEVPNKESWRSRVSFFRRIFNRSKKNAQYSAQNKPRPGPICIEESTPNRVSVNLSPHAYPQPGRHKMNTRQVSHYTWLPEVGLPSHSSLIATSKLKHTKLQSEKLKKNRKSNQKQSSPPHLKQSQSKRNSVLRRSSSIQSESGEKDNTDWPVVQRMVLCAVIFEEFCKEMAALCIEHSVRS